MNTNGAVIWEGASLLDGAPIVVIVVGLITRMARQGNRKTGAMLQTYILRRDMSPIVAIHAGLDASICGACVHRGPTGDGLGRTCYVNIGQGPTIVFKQYAKGAYARADAIEVAEFGRDRMVRLGTYGDPAAVPAWVWLQLTAHATGTTGYTHQWRSVDAKTWAPLVMASADTAKDARDAWAMGYRTFRVTLDTNEKIEGREVLCPASKEAGAKIQCEQCKACSGTSTGRKGSIYIPLHGGNATIANAPKLAVRLIARSAA